MISRANLKRNILPWNSFSLKVDYLSDEAVSPTTSTVGKSDFFHFLWQALSQTFECFLLELKIMDLGMDGTVSLWSRNPPIRLS